MEQNKKERLDILLVKRNLVSSREKAKAAIQSGMVLVNGTRKEKKAGMFVEENAVIELIGEPFPYVSRGGLKLEKALKTFQISLNGLVCMDIGASTGGFTDCMLCFGAKKVIAVDVGTNQLASKLKQEERVISMEQTNIRYVTPEQIGQKVQFVSIDVSFISLTKILSVVVSLMEDRAKVVCLVKPQFEAGKERVGKKGVVKERAVHKEVLKQVLSFAIQVGFKFCNLTFSPIKGSEGNIEYLLYLMKQEKAADISLEQEKLIEDMVDTAFKMLPC